MTKQRKQEKKAVLAQAITRMHAQGEKGPSKTSPNHNKRYTYRSNPDTLKRIAEAVKAKQEVKGEKTSGKRILRDAGKAAQPQAN